MSEGVRGQGTREERRAIGDCDAPKVPAAERCAKVAGVGIPAARSRFRVGPIDGWSSYVSPASQEFIAHNSHHDRWSGDGTVDGE